MFAGFPNEVAVRVEKVVGGGVRAVVVVGEAFDAIEFPVGGLVAQGSHPGFFNAVGDVVRDYAGVVERGELVLGELVALCYDDGAGEEGFLGGCFLAKNGVVEVEPVVEGDLDLCRDVVLGCELVGYLDCGRLQFFRVQDGHIFDVYNTGSGTPEALALFEEVCNADFGRWIGVY